MISKKTVWYFLNLERSVTKNRKLQMTLEEYIKEDRSAFFFIWRNPFILDDENCRCSRRKRVSVSGQHSLLKLKYNRITFSR